jgi:acyl-homoserine-lactone acylase
MALSYTDEGPQAEMLLSYSQSHDPESAFFSDQTQQYSQLQWRPVRFTESEVTDNTVETLELTQER